MNLLFIPRTLIPIAHHSMDPLLDLLQKNARYSTAELAELLTLDEEAVAARIRELESGGEILGYHAVIEPEKAGDTGVVAFIDVKITPERDGGFDHLARRIARFEQVSNCFLMSGGYDLSVVVEGRDLREVAGFVAQKLSTMEGVLSTVTHFQLKVYKKNGFMAEKDPDPDRLAVTP